MEWIRELRRNPFFRREVARPQVARWSTLLAAANLLYVGLFLAAYFRQSRHPEFHGPQTTREFSHEPWLVAGALLLSLCAHWLVPPFLLRNLARDYDLHILTLMVRERRGSEDVLRGQVAAAVAPLCIGVLPLAAGSLLLVVCGPRYTLPAVEAVAGGVLWGGLCSTVTAWIGAGRHGARGAALRTYAWTCLVLPLLIGAASATIAVGCASGQHLPRRQAVFNAAAAITWAILVTGCAAAFWDLAQRRYFPEKHRSLWLEAPAEVEAVRG